MNQQLRVLVADDSLAFRAALVDALSGLNLARIVALAADGREAVSKCKDFKPDVMTLDLEMPILDGFQVLGELRPHLEETAVIMISAMTQRGAKATLRALELGAFGFVTKPEGGTREANREALRSQLEVLFAAVQARRKAPGPSPAKPVNPAAVAPRPSTSVVRAEIIAIGCSTGGPRALNELLPRLPKSLPTPVLVVQHMPPLFTGQLAEGLAGKCALKVVEAQQGMRLSPGTIYIAPGGKQTRVVEQGGGKGIELTDDPPENFCRPSVDYTFRSLVKSYRANAVGVILTGMGQDGARGLLQMRQAGAATVGEDATTCTVYGMPREAFDIGAVENQLPLGRIAEHLVSLVSGGQKA